MMKTGFRNHALRGGFAALTAAVVLLAGCSAGPITYQEATEIYDTIGGLEERLEDVESMLATVRSNGDMDGDVENTLSRAEDEVIEVASSLGELNEKFEPAQQQQPEGVTPQPSPQY